MSRAVRPIDADVNAAANIGLRFLRGIEDFRVRIDGGGRPKKSLRYANVERFDEMPEPHGGAMPYWQPSSTTKKRNEKAKLEDEATEASARDGAEEDAIPEQLFRDPSGHVFSADRWYLADRFWGHVFQLIDAAVGKDATQFA